VTIFLTTHYLPEADYLCNRLAIIDYGKIIALGSPQSLKSELGKVRYVTLNIDNNFKKFIDLLNSANLKAEQVGKDVRVSVEKPDEITKIITLAKKYEFKINEVSMKEPSLDDVFFHYTGRQIREV
jgi:ABC-2 type transport system ATP-binding protein